MVSRVFVCACVHVYGEGRFVCLCSYCMHACECVCVCVLAGQ